MTQPQIKMKTLKYLLQGIITTAVLFVLFIMLTLRPYKERILEIGQVWIHYYDPKNPFDAIDTLKILNIKDDYVQFRKNNTETMSLSKKDFVDNSELLIDNQ